MAAAFPAASPEQRTMLMLMERVGRLETALHQVQQRPPPSPVFYDTMRGLFSDGSSICWLLSDPVEAATLVSPGGGDRKPITEAHLAAEVGIPKRFHFRGYTEQKHLGGIELYWIDSEVGIAVYKILPLTNLTVRALLGSAKDLIVGNRQGHDSDVYLDRIVHRVSDGTAASWGGELWVCAHK